MAPPVPCKSFNLKEKVEIIRCKDSSGLPVHKLAEKFGNFFIFHQTDTFVS